MVEQALAKPRFDEINVSLLRSVLLGTVRQWVPRGVSVERVLSRDARPHRPPISTFLVTFTGEGSAGGMLAARIREDGWVETAYTDRDSETGWQRRTIDLSATDGDGNKVLRPGETQYAKKAERDRLQRELDGDLERVQGGVEHLNCPLINPEVLRHEKVL